VSASTFSDQPRRVARNFSWLTLQELLIRLIGLASAMYLAGAAVALFYKAIFAWPLLLKLPLAALSYGGLAILLRAVVRGSLGTARVRRGKGQYRERT
jgi:hypothetical protein